MANGNKKRLRLFSPDRERSWIFPVLWEDDHLMALAKMSHIRITHDPEHPHRPALMTLLHHAIGQGEPWTTKRNVDFLGPIYRLDFEASGIVLLARNQGIQAKLGDIFGANQCQRTYYALVHGSPEEEMFEVEAKMGWIPREPGLMRAHKTHGKKALSRFEVAERFAAIEARQGEMEGGLDQRAEDQSSELAEVRATMP